MFQQNQENINNNMDLENDNFPNQNQIQEEVNYLLANFNADTYSNYCNHERINLNDEQFENHLTANANKFFEKWKGTVEYIVFTSVDEEGNQLGMLLKDLPDFWYRDSFDSDVTPFEMAAYVLQNIP